ncbi:MAG TPA: cytochrome c biogenesis protein DipZ [Gaiellaceae bacterium]|nr:cytochrome c biogenesis protein DipZ [Gaiellaceae bacterium]
MLLLLGVAFVAGVVTAISPCVLPVLPIVLAGGASGGRARPYAIIAGLVASFTVFTLLATAFLTALGLPQDLLRDLAVAAVFVLAVSLVWPRLADLLSRPFAALARRRPGDVGGGFLLGITLGLLFTPCAGPVIAAVATVAATERLSLDAAAVMLAYALGSGTVLLGVAVAARHGFGLAAVRRNAPAVRRALGVAIAAVAVLMVLGVDKKLQTRVPEYTRALQALEGSAAAQTELERLAGMPGRAEESALGDYGSPPEFAGVAEWINSRPLTLAGLRGKVVVVDFWTYSCINCLRTLPHVKRWYETYRDAGLVVVGVHSPEFAFERVAENVRRAVNDLGIEYPVALDNEFETWSAWGNRYWPAKYFVDRDGRLRYAHFGEGDYEASEEVIRTLLAEERLPEPVAGTLPDETPTGYRTPETYLGWHRLARFAGSRIVPDREATYRIPPSLPRHGLAYGGRWTLEEERIVAGRGARLRLRFVASDVFLVLGTRGETETVAVRVDGRRLRTVRVSEHDLHTLARIQGRKTEHVLDLRFSPGTEAYAFTFG